ncbi:hypothetical protein [Rhodococcus koreensis]
MRSAMTRGTPVIGAAVGSAAGLTGVAATSAGLATLSRRLAELESATDTALAVGIPDRLPDTDTAEHLSYVELTAANDRLRTQRRWTDVDLDAALTPEQRAGFDRWRARQRIQWDRDDLLAVGFAIVLGGGGPLV